MHDVPRGLLPPLPDPDAPKKGAMDPPPTKKDLRRREVEQDTNPVKAQAELDRVFNEHLPHVQALSRALQSHFGIRDDEKWPIPALPYEHREGLIESNAQKLRDAVTNCKNYGLNMERKSDQQEFLDPAAMGLGKRVIKKDGNESGERKLKVDNPNEVRAREASEDFQGLQVDMDLGVGGYGNDEGGSSVDPSLADAGIGLASSDVMEGIQSATPTPTAPSTIPSAPPTATPSYEYEEYLAGSDTAELTQIENVTISDQGNANSITSDVEMEDEEAPSINSAGVGPSNNAVGARSPLASSTQSEKDRRYATAMCGLGSEEGFGSDGNLLSESEFSRRNARRERRQRDEAEAHYASLSYIDELGMPGFPNIDEEADDEDGPTTGSGPPHTSQSDQTNEASEVMSALNEAGPLVHTSEASGAHSLKNEESGEEQPKDKGKGKDPSFGEQLANIPVTAGGETSKFAEEQQAAKAQKTRDPPVPQPENMPGTLTQIICNFFKLSVNPILSLTLEDVTASILAPKEKRSSLLRHFEVGMDGVEGLCTGHVMIPESESMVEEREERLQPLGTIKSDMGGHSYALQKEQNKKLFGKGIWVFYCVKFKQLAKEKKNRKGGKWFCFGCPIEARTRLEKEGMEKIVRVSIGGGQDREGNDTLPSQFPFKRTQSLFSRGGVCPMDIWPGGEEWDDGLFKDIENAMAQNCLRVGFLYGTPLNVPTAKQVRTFKTSKTIPVSKPIKGCSYGLSTLI